MLGSKSDFFKSNDNTLMSVKIFMVKFLKEHKTSDDIIKLYEDAFNYFIVNPDDFDGTTILKDVKIMPNLDIFAMIHDYMYIKFNVASNLKYKFICDKIFSLEIERCGLPWEISWVRFGLLTLSTLIYTPYRMLSGDNMSDEDKIEFNNLIKKFNHSSP